MRSARWKNTGDWSMSVETGQAGKGKRGRRSVVGGGAARRLEGGGSEVAMVEVWTCCSDTRRTVLV